MEEDIIRLYQEAIALLRLRNNVIEIYGEYDYDENGGVSFVLNYFPENIHRSKTETINFNRSIQRIKKILHGRKII